MDTKWWGRAGDPIRAAAFVLLLIALAGSGCKSADVETASNPTVTAESLPEATVTADPLPEATVTAESLPEATVTAESLPEATVTAESLPEEPVIVSEPVLVTPCFVTGPELLLPDGWIAADVSAGSGDCLFVLQAEGLADTTVIAGELFFSSSGLTFDEIVGRVEAGLATGQEPDILALQLLNTGASGRDLPILDRTELFVPNQAVLFVHESDRRDGYNALSGVVKASSTTAPNASYVIQLWGLLGPSGVIEPQQSVNYQLAIDLINSMQIDAP